MKRVANSRLAIRTIIGIGCFVLVAGLATVVAQRATLQATEVDAESFLVDSYGRSLYVYLPDEGGASTCYDECEKNWPPLLVRSTPSAGERLDPALLGTTERDDGTTQLTYGGWPLYYYSGDATAGVYFGQGVNEQWYLVSETGEPLKDLPATQPPASETSDEAEASEEEPEPAAEEAETETAEDPTQSAASEAIDQELYAKGQQVFSNICATCHGQSGGGGEGVRLVGNSALEDAQHVADVVLHGFGYMPAIGAGFSNEEVAAVATYIRNSWGNEFGPVSLEDVEAVR